MDWMDYYVCYRVWKSAVSDIVMGNLAVSPRSYKVNCIGYMCIVIAREWVLVLALLDCFVSLTYYFHSPISAYCQSVIYFWCLISLGHIATCPYQHLSWFCLCCTVWLLMFNSPAFCTDSLTVNSLLKWDHTISYTWFPLAAKCLLHCSASCCSYKCYS